MFNKDVLMKFIQAQQQKTQPVVSNEGFLNGAPEPGTNYRIPSDTLYNPTPHRIKAVSDNGIEAELQPYDETNVHFPGAEYVDEYEMRYGGLQKFLPKAQPGLEVKHPVIIPADADRYGINAKPVQNAEYVDPDLVNRLDYTQQTINQQSAFGNPRKDFEEKVLQQVNKLDGFDVSQAGYLPDNLKNGSEYYCISGVCYTLNQAGEPIRYYSNSLAQDDVRDGKVPNWKLNYDTGSVQGGDILQFTGNHEIPHHAGLVVPNSIKTNEDGTKTFDVFMNDGDGKMFKTTYTVDPKTDMANNGETTQLLTRDFGDAMSQAANIRDWLKEKILDQDPQFFTRKKGAKSRWESYSPGFFNEKGRTYVTMGDEPIGYSSPTMMQSTNPEVRNAAELLLKNTGNYDIDYNALSKTGGFNQIIDKVNNEDFKMDFMKRYNISNREYNAIVSNTFGIYGQESGFGTKPGGLMETDGGRRVGSVVEDVMSRLSGNGAKRRDVEKDYSRGLTQVKLRNLDNKDIKKYGITAEALDSDPEKAFIAAMIVNAQNLPELRKLAMKGETASLDQSNYLDFLPYMYSMPGRLRRGDKKTIQWAEDLGLSPEDAVVMNPNDSRANNEYLKNVRTFSNLFQHVPSTSTMEYKNGGALHKFLPKAQDGKEVGMDWETLQNPVLAARALAMGHDSIASYRNANWGYGPNAKKSKMPDFAKERLYQYLSEKEDSVFDNRLEGIKRNDENFLKQDASDQSFVEQVMKAGTPQSIQPERIALTKGRFNLGSVSTETVDKLLAAAKRQGVDPYVMLGLAGRESTFGSGYGRGEEDLRSLVSGWDVADPYLPYDLNRFLADKKVPGVSTSKSFHGWDFKAEDMDAINKHLQQNPELIKQYLAKIRKTAEIGDLTTLDMAAQKIKQDGIAGYNPGDPRYTQMMQDDIRVLKQDPALMQYLQSKGIREFGGMLEEYKQGGNMIKRADGSYSQRGLWDNIRDNAGSGRKPTEEMLKQERKINKKRNK